MRTIGRINSQQLAERFGRYLHSQQIGHELEESGGEWDVWILAEDDLSSAAELLKAFTADPDNPQYLQPPPLPAAPAPNPVPAPKAEPPDESPQLRSPGPPGPVTLTLIGICAIVHLLKNSGYEEAILRHLFMTATTSDGNFLKWTPGMSELRAGEYWRLLSPVVVHADWLHLLLNMFWLFDLGGHVERQRGGKFLTAFVLITAVLSNLGQYFIFNPAFCGLSGVLYALLGYVWMKSKYDPTSGLHLPMQNLVWMLLWFGLCLAEIIPNVANGAHAVGLAAGTLWGILSSLPSMKRTQA